MWISLFMKLKKNSIICPHLFHIPYGSCAIWIVVNYVTLTLIVCVCVCITNFMSTSTVYYSVICQGKQLFFYNFHKIDKKLSYLVSDWVQNFLKGSKINLKKLIFTNFYIIFQNEFLHTLQLQFPQLFVVLGNFCLPFS